MRSASRVRLLAVDLDFTLLDGERTIPPRNAEALRKAQNCGIQVVLCSGRIASGMRLYAEELGLSSPLISCNGAYVVAQTGEILADFRVPQAVSRYVLSCCRENHLPVNVYADDTIHLVEDGEWFQKYLRRVRRANVQWVDLEGMLNLNPNKIILLSDPLTIRDLYERFTRYFQKEEVSIWISEPEYLEFINGACDKGTGLQCVASHLGFQAEEVAAIGDYYNDLPMLEWAGHSAAVANAPPEVQERVDLVVAPHEEGGVAEYVDFLVEAKQG
ncbi:MAG: Cof-type HAD-IIB family hydrolase [Fimbriimonadales bacterium]|nr:Cof-type HAD-IIB family hydrolase [Fimbriimonadales bacterium]